MKNKTHSALYIADVILSLSKPEYGDLISNLKLQKLLYYAQGFNLALYDAPLFHEPLVAWQYGPVVEDVYHKFKDYESDGIEPPDDVDLSELTKEQKELLKEVYEVYGQFSALKLMEMTHNEPPWMTTAIGRTISRPKLVNFFTTRLRKDGEKEKA